MVGLVKGDGWQPVPAERADGTGQIEDLHVRSVTGLLLWELSLAQLIWFPPPCVILQDRFPSLTLL
jgi:hypothetical protein